MVNSEEGYQNLRRFLFGDLQVQVELVGLDVQGREDDDTIWQLETSLAIRGLPVLVHESFIDHLEQSEDLQDILVIDIAADQQQPIRAWATWNSAIPDAIRDWTVSPEYQLADQATETPELWLSTIALPRIAHRLLGDNAAIQITVVRHALSPVK